MTPCPACGETAFRPASRRWGEQTRLSIGPSRESAARVELERCARCGLLRQSEPAASRDLAALYEQLEDHFTSRKSLAVDAPSRWPCAVSAAPSGAGRLLDIGCATGLFLEIAASRGWVVEGVEPSASACERARRSGMLVTQGFFEDLPPPARPFDVVTMWDVLEHVPDPARAVARPRRSCGPRRARRQRAGGRQRDRAAARKAMAVALVGAPTLLHETVRRASLLVARLRHPRIHDTPGVLRNRVREPPAGPARTGTARGLHGDSEGGSSDVSVPLLMGEFTVVARRAG